MEQQTSKIGNSDKSQTGVDYIWEHMCMLFLWHDGIPDELQDALNNAKQIEKQQHGDTWDAAIQAHDDCGGVHARSIVDFDEYYNYTFKK